MCKTITLKIGTYMDLLSPSKVNQFLLTFMSIIKKRFNILLLLKHHYFKPIITLFVCLSINCKWLFRGYSSKFYLYEMYMYIYL